MLKTPDILKIECVDCEHNKPCLRGEVGFPWFTVCAYHGIGPYYTTPEEGTPKWCPKLEKQNELSNQTKTKENTQASTEKRS